MDKLTIIELKNAQTLIDKMKSGVYELKDIYGSEWDVISTPTKFGMLFKEAVESGKLLNICMDDKKSNNHQTYKIRR